MFKSQPKGNSNETRGVLFFNRGEKCAVRLVVALYTLRKHYHGDVTVFLEEPYPKELDFCCEYFACNVVHSEPNLNSGALVRKTELFVNSPYDRTIWLDADTVTVGKIDELFDLLDDADVVIPDFCGWLSSGNKISNRIKTFKGVVSDEMLLEAQNGHPAINTGIFSYRKNIQFMKDWIDLAQKGEGKIWIADEIAFQILYPFYDNIKVGPMKYNTSVVYGEKVEDKRVIHYHGQKHVFGNNLSQVWVDTFNEMRKDNIANIESVVQYADKRLAKFLGMKRPRGYLKSFPGNAIPGNALQGNALQGNALQGNALQGNALNLDQNAKQVKNDGLRDDVTIVTACDDHYVGILRETFANWRKYKKIDEFPVIVFVNGIPFEDSRLDFLKLPNVKIIPWSMPDAESHREEMLSAFVFGTAEHVKTEFWLKLDADSYAINDKPLFSEDMKKYAFCGHKWTYSRPEHIKMLDEWARTHRQPKLKNAKPMLSEGKIEGNRFYHNKRRTISYIQLHKSKFTRFCVKLLGNKKKLPAPTQDTYMFFVCDRFDPQFIGTADFKRDHGFIQGRGKLGAEHIKEVLSNVENNKVNVENVVDEDKNIVDSKKDIDNVKTVIDNVVKDATISSIPFLDSTGKRCVVQVEN